MKRLRPFLIVMLVVGGYAGLHLLHRTHASRADKAPHTLVVSVVHPTSKTVTLEVPATGVVVPREDVAVLSELSAVRVTQVFADVGDRVKKGQTLATLDSQSLALRVQQMEADAVAARDAHSRVAAIADTGAVSARVVTEKRTAMEAANARLADAQLDLRRTTVTAPESGLVYARHATLGGLVNANDPLFRIARGQELEAQLRVSEGDVGRIQPRQSVTLAITGYAAPYAGTVRLIAPAVDPASRTAQIRVALAPHGTTPGARIIGSFVRATIAVGAQTGVGLPATALEEDTQGAFVWVVDTHNTAIRQSVTLLARQDNTVLVEGLTPEMRVIAKAGAFVKAGDTVNPVEAR